MAFAPRIREELTQICGSKWVKDDEVTLYTYRSDGLTLYTKLPMGIVYPANSEELVRVVKVLYREKLTFLARGAGTGLSGGAVPQEDTVIIEMDRFKEIHDIDYINRTIT
ncbi:MAG: FAD-binding oxidoreductase, partial [Firmicutes bacterium]|nr:FAD-binding oxidoreductase [Bacillota bacterium]